MNISRSAVPARPLVQGSTPTRATSRSAVPSRAASAESAQLFHYAVKSTDVFAMKQDRGDGQGKQGDTKYRPGSRWHRLANRNDEDAPEMARHLPAIKARLTDMAARQGYEAIGDVRGLGAMVAFELVSDRDTNNPDAALTQAIVAEAEARGLIILPCGTRGNAVRLLPPLTTPMAQVEEALDILEASIEAAINTTAQAAE